MPTDVLTDSDHKSQLMYLFKMVNGMQKMQEKQTLCDITIKVDGQSFHAHRIVLAAASEYFAAMLTSDFQESQQSEVVINGNPEAFRILLDFAYSGELTTSLDTAVDVYEMAHYLRFDIPLQRCQEFLKSKLQEVEACPFDNEAVLRILTKSDMFGFEEVAKKSKEYLAKNFKVSEQFLVHMTPELMQEMLDRCDLNMDEKEVRGKWFQECS